MFRRLDVWDSNGLNAELTRSKQLQHQTKRIILAAITMTVVAAGLFSFAALISPVPAAVKASLSTGESIGLSGSLPADRTHGAEGDSRPEFVVNADVASAKGWYRIQKRSMVRKEMDLNSHPILVLPEGALVWIEEIQGRRARVARPVTGWCSVRTADGLELLSREEFRSNSTADQVDALLMTDSKFVTSRKRLEELQTRLAYTKNKLSKSVDQLKLQKRVNQLHEAVHIAVNQAPQLGQQGTKVLEKVVHKEKAQSLLDAILEEPKVKGLINSAEDSAAHSAQHLGQQLEKEMEVDNLPSKLTQSPASMEKAAREAASAAGLAH
mmetsp:Transcript_11529/g.25355  ORF Transcript_11529/g.25355 Transcript_11529/m.25355 type:complete len:325 (+) Transcript_11529:96-1070(+)